MQEKEKKKVYFTREVETFFNTRLLEYGFKKNNVLGSSVGGLLFTNIHDSMKNISMGFPPDSTQLGKVGTIMTLLYYGEWKDLYAGGKKITIGRFSRRDLKKYSMDKNYDERHKMYEDIFSDIVKYGLDWLDNPVSEETVDKRYIEEIGLYDIDENDWSAAVKNILTETLASLGFEAANESRYSICYINPAREIAPKRGAKKAKLQIRIHATHTHVAALNVSIGLTSLPGLCALCRAPIGDKRKWLDDDEWIWPYRSPEELNEVTGKIGSILKNEAIPWLNGELDTMPEHVVSMDEKKASRLLVKKSKKTR